MGTPCEEDSSAGLRESLLVGKLYFALSLGWHPVARGRAISPGAHRLQYSAVSCHACTLKNQWTVHAAICPDDEADFHLSSVRCRGEQRIRCSQCLWRFHCRARPSRTDVRNVNILRRPPQCVRHLCLALRQATRMRAPHERASPQHHRKKQNQHRSPDPTQHGFRAVLPRKSSIIQSSPEQPPRQ